MVVRVVRLLVKPSQNKALLFAAVINAHYRSSRLVHHHAAQFAYHKTVITIHQCLCYVIHTPMSKN